LKGGCASEFLTNLNLPEDTAASIAKFGNLGVAQSTWNSYRTAQTMLLKCEKETKENLEIPLDDRKVLIFIDWLARCRGLKSASITSYLSGIRQLHIVRGIDPPQIRTGLVKLVLRGIANSDGIKARELNLTGRLPMTTNVMLLFQKLLSKLEYSSYDRAMIWATATLAFAGAFRINELLCKRESTFDPDFELLTENVILNIDLHYRTTIQVVLKCPKENKTNVATTVDVYQNDGPLCPVAALRLWGGHNPLRAKLPLFCFQDGTPLTGSKMNKILERTLGLYTDKSIGKFTTHSFRIGLASELGRLGCSDEEIKEAGRWSSRAFERYIKLRRTRRATAAALIRKLNGAIPKRYRIR